MNFHEQFLEAFAANVVDTVFEHDGKSIPVRVKVLSFDEADPLQKKYVKSRKSEEAIASMDFSTEVLRVALVDENGKALYKDERLFKEFKKATKSSYDALAAFVAKIALDLGDEKKDD